MPERPNPRRIIVLGSTGSIGQNTLRVISHLSSLREDEGRKFDVVGLAAGSNAAELRRQADAFGVSAVAIADPSDEVAAGAPHTGPDAALDLVATIAQPGDLIVAAMVGAAGIPAVLAGIEAGCDIALANKETLVAAGELVMRAARSKGVEIIPIDSEHSAVAQALRTSGRAPESVRRIVLTASGGPFRSWPKDRMDNASIEEALDHPTWSMGPKVSIDSASLMNKGLELIEAHWLFDAPAEKLDAIVHPQSIVHALVEFTDRSVIAQLAAPDMKLPIQIALTWPDCAAGCSAPLDLEHLGTLEFEPVDRSRFPAIDIAREAIQQGGTAGAIFNAANEVAVEAFLAGAIAFGRIPGIVSDTISALDVHPADSLDAIEASDQEARATARECAGLVSPT